MLTRKVIRITAIPPGEAPQSVREAWVGLLLPLPRWPAQPKAWRSAGVLTGPRTLLARLSALFSGKLNRSSGYAVLVLEALAALERARPDAAAWWRQNTPHLVRPGKVFVFAAEVCHVEDARVDA